jgi:hypothetical protein
MRLRLVPRIFDVLAHRLDDDEADQGNEAEEDDVFR